MAKVQFLTYYICLADQDLVAQYQQTQWIPAVSVEGTIPLGVVNRAITPNAADVEFNAPFRGFTDPHTPGENYIWTPWSGIGEEDGPFPLNIATFVRKTGGFWIFGGTKTRYYWMGQFVFVPPANGSGGVPATPDDLTEVVWADGFELPGEGEGGVNAAANDKCSPMSSRHLGGWGMRLRGDAGTSFKEHRWNEYGAANPSTGWNRLYIRLIRVPDSQGYFWDCHTSTSATPAVALKFTTSRTLAVYSIQSTVLSFLTALSYVFELDRWYRLDILMKCGQNPPNDGRFRLYVTPDDGSGRVKIADLNFTTSEGLGGGGASPRLQDCRVGTDGASPGFELDVDDWIGLRFPNGTDEGWTGRDWQSGSRCALVRSTGFGPNHSVNWAGSHYLTQQRPIEANTAGASLVSTTSGAIAEIETDFEREVQAISGALGVTAFHVGVYHARAAGTVDSQLGYALDGSTFVNANVQGTTTQLWKNVLKSQHGAGINTPPAIAGPVRLRFTKSADVTSVDLRALAMVAHVIGVFGPEDVSSAGDPITNPARGIGIHNWHYPRSPWALGGLPPLSPVQIIAGTFVGDNLAEDLLFSVPVHWLWIRPLTAGTGGVQWWSSMTAAHIQCNQGVLPEAVVRVRMNELFDGAPPASPGEDAEAQSMQAVLTPSGSNSQVNATGVTYQYVAICDPGQRIMVNGAFKHGTSPASFANPLADSGFLPLLAFLSQDHVTNVTTDGVFWKGPGNGIDSWQLLSAAEAASAIEFSEGFITSKSAAHNTTEAQTAYAAFRDDDGILDANGASQRGKVVQVWSYVGDGAASRTLAFQVPVGRRPLFAIIGPTNGTVFFRDPSNTTNTSQNISGTNSTTAITGGGLDSISIGTTLNSNGVTYNVFLVVGGTTAGNGGWGINESLVPVEPDTAPGDQWGDEFPGEPVDEGDEEAIPPDDMATDLEAECLPFTTKIANLALSRLGISKQIADLSTELSKEAETIRLHYGIEVGNALREHPWSFATRYAELVLVDGDETDPVNGDWTFAYRAPTNMMFARRILRPGMKRTDTDLTPIEFREGSDSTGLLIYTNQSGEENPVELEYTIRLTCPASQGDTLFRSFLAWKLAAAIAPALTRDTKKMSFALEMAEVVKSRAQVAVEREQQQPKQGDVDWIAGR